MVKPKNRYTQIIESIFAQKYKKVLKKFSSKEMILYKQQKNLASHFLKILAMYYTVSVIVYAYLKL